MTMTMFTKRSETPTATIVAELLWRLDPEHRKGSNAHSMFLNNAPCVTCVDGFNMSVQASFIHYCHPRDNCGSWTAVEVGFPSERVELLMPYIDGAADTDPTDTVYGYVPIGLVAEIILQHGGFMKEEKDPC